MNEPRRDAISPQVPKLSALGVRAHCVAMLGVLRGLFEPSGRRVAQGAGASTRIPSATNDRRALRKTTPASRLSFRTRRVVHLVVLLMRLVVAMTAVQITGIPHVLADAVAAVQSDEDHEHNHENCPNDDDGRQCPPGCPSCHCTHAMSALPILPVAMFLEPLIPIEVAAAPYEAQGPPNPEIMTLYRPPRRIST